MITFNSVSKSFGSQNILDDVSFVVDSYARIALIGKNGSGKTTLLEILNGTLTPDGGTVIRNDEIIGYVAQDMHESNSPDQSQFEVWRLEYALQQVGLNPTVLTRSLRDLSGGERTRLSIAHVLARNPTPTVLLLDEPTNNLDKEGIQWLRNFIASFQGAVVIVSHDRAFINDVSQTLWVLADGNLTDFKGNYDDYQQFQQQERERTLKEYEAHRQERKKVEAFVREATDRSQRGVRDQRSRDNDKFIKNFKNEYVQNSFGKRTKALQTRLEKLGDANAPMIEKEYQVTLSGTVHASKAILSFDHITKSYENSTVIDDFNLAVLGADRIWVKGRNGSGKTTLLKIAAGGIEPDSGTIEYGNNVGVGYFSQDVYGLDLLISAYETFSRLYIEDEKIYKTAKSIELSPELLHRKISTLSRGQQAKIGFLKLLLSDYDLLILDEPTNHLDIATKESIEQALNSYKGALMIASHDRYFVNNLNINKEIEM